MYDITNPQVAVPEYTALENIAEFISYCQKQQGEQFHLNIEISTNYDGLPEVRIHAYFKDRLDDGHFYKTITLNKIDALNEAFKILANKSEFAKLVYGDAKEKLKKEAQTLSEHLTTLKNRIADLEK